MSIIDTLSAGFSAVNKRLWVITVPALLDLLLWQGPKLTAEGLIQRVFDFYADFASSSAAAGQYMASSGQADTVAQVTKMGEDLRGMDFFTFLAWQLPSLMSSQLGHPPAGLFNMPVLNVDSGLLLLGLIVGMGFLSLLMQSAYLSLVVQAIRAGDFNPGFMAGRIALNWARLIGFFALVALGAMVVGIPVLGAATVVGLLSPTIGSLMMGLMAAIGLWVALYLFFAVAAMFIGDVGPITAAWHSFSIVRRYFWSALALIALVVLIRFGVSRVWDLALGHPMGVFGAIVGNAYIDAGLAAACMIYYQVRYAKWREERDSRQPSAISRQAGN